MNHELTSEYFEKTWPLSDVSLGEVLQETNGRTIGIINARQGKFVYKTAGQWKTNEALARDLQAFELLPLRGFHHIPELLKTSDRKAFSQIDRKPIYLLEYVIGERPQPTAETYHKLGRLTAELHLIRDYPYETDFHPAPIIARNLPNIAKGLSFKEEYLRVVEALPSFEALPQTIIHTDIAPINAVEKANGDLILLDWDDVGVGIRVLDIAFPLIQQFVSEDGEFLEDNAHSFYAAYFSKISLIEDELDHIFPAALFIALMYIKYGDTQKRWQRIQWAIENRRMLEDVIRFA